jgi:hypothetical protein
MVALTSDTVRMKKLKQNFIAAVLRRTSSVEITVRIDLVPDVPDDADCHHHDAQRCDSDCSQAVLPIAVAFHPKHLSGKYRRQRPEKILVAGVCETLRTLHVHEQTVRLSRRLLRDRFGFPP